MEFYSIAKLIIRLKTIRMVIRIKCQKLKKEKVNKRDSFKVLHLKYQ